MTDANSLPPVPIGHTAGFHALRDIPVAAAGETAGDIQRRLAQLGFLPGNRIRIIRSAPFHGPLLLEVEGREIVLGRGVAAHIIVEYV